MSTNFYFPGAKESIPRQSLGAALSTNVSKPAERGQLPASISVFRRGQGYLCLNKGHCNENTYSIKFEDLHPDRFRHVAVNSNQPGVSCLSGSLGGFRLLYASL